MDKLFQSIFNESVTQTGSVQPWVFFSLLATAVVIGLFIAFCYMFRNEYSKNLVISLAILPPIVTVLIMLASGNIGVGVAIGGVFALTRFRSAQGTAKEITHIFLSMAIGLTLGLGYIFIAIILAVVVEALNFVFIFTKFGDTNPKKRTLKITIPESLDYEGVFDDIFKRYTDKSELTKIRLSSLGTMFQLTYSIVLKDYANEKEFIDEIRERNGNLDILCSKVEAGREEL